MDVLSDLLQSVRLTGAIFFNVRAGRPMVAETPPISAIRDSVMPGWAHVIPFHIMLRGSCWAELIDGSAPAEELSEGDIAIYPRGDGHVFGSAPGRRFAPDLDVYRRPADKPLPFMLEIGEPSASPNRFVCGYFGCDAAPFNPLLDALPRQLIARRPPAGNHIEVDLIEAAIEETEKGRAGGETVLARLSELLFVRVLRRHIETMPERSTGWLAGLGDPQIARALQCIHGEPARGWTLEDLARASGMSRSVLAERFTEVVGETPMRYLTRWRMQRATCLLNSPGRTIDAVAAEVGYQSESAFSRAFKTLVGESPGSWRRKAIGAEG